MPRKARIDTPGGLHHVMDRGIECRKTFRDNAVRELGETATALAKKIGLSKSGVSKAVLRGEKNSKRARY